MVLGIIFLNLALYRTTDFGGEEGSVNESVLHQLYFLKERIASGEAEEMQRVFPEGFMFFHALYGLSWCDLIRNLDPRSELFKEGIREINASLKALQSEEARAPFSKTLSPAYGIYYMGWGNYLLGKKLALQKKESRLSGDLELYNANCDGIIEALGKSTNPYLESYQDSAWPSDTLVAVASLTLLPSASKSEFVKTWIARVKKNLDPKTGLIPHSVRPNGKVKDSSRGSSQSLLLIFLAEIDPVFAAKQYKIYSRLFLQERFGLSALREFPRGIQENGDVDSGPIIWGVGTAATIVGQRTSAAFEDWHRYEAFKSCLNVVGFSYDLGGEKKYVFGMAPMADTFLVWSNAAEIEGSLSYSSWRWPFHFRSMAILFLFLLGFIFFRKML